MGLENAAPGRAGSCRQHPGTWQGGSRGTHHVIQPNPRLPGGTRALLKAVAMSSPSRCPCEPGSYYEPQIRKEARRRELACPRSHWKTGRTTRNRVSLFCTWTRRFQEPQNSPILVSKTSFSLLSAHHPLCHAHFCRKKLLQEHPSHSPCNIFPKLNSKISFFFFFLVDLLPVPC